MDRRLFGSVVTGVGIGLLLALAVPATLIVGLLVLGVGLLLMVV